MNGRKQFAILNGNVSTKMPIKFGRVCPRPHLIRSLPSKVIEGTVYMYADDTTLFCIGRTVDEVIKSLNLAGPQGA